MSVAFALRKFSWLTVPSGWIDGGTANEIAKALGAVPVMKPGSELPDLLSSGADYSDLYFALQQACTNLFGTSADCVEVKDALDAVEMNGQPAPNFNTNAPLCTTAGTFPNIFFADDLESGSSNWTFNNGPYTRWQLDSPYAPFAQSGLHSLYADDAPAAVTDATARLASFIVPSNAYLHFAHAYGFEADTYYWDGGVLEYSINNGVTWVDAGYLMDYNGYRGTIFPDYNNPLKGRSAFVGTSHGYISTRLNLASLGNTAIDDRTAKVQVTPVRMEIFIDLYGQFSGRNQYQCMGMGGTFFSNVIHYREQKCCSFSCPCLCGGNKIPARHNNRNSFFLYWCGFSETHIFN